MHNCILSCLATPPCTLLSLARRGLPPTPTARPVSESRGFLSTLFGGGDDDDADARADELGQALETKQAESLVLQLQLDNLRSVVLQQEQMMAQIARAGGAAAAAATSCCTPQLVPPAALGWGERPSCGRYSPRPAELTTAEDSRYGG